MMKLVKTNEQVNKIYNEEGNATEQVASINYNILESGSHVGSASIWQGGYSLSVNNSSTIEANQQKLEEMFNLTTEE